MNCDFLKSCSDFNYGFNENEKDFLVFKVAVSTEKFSQRLYIDKKSKTWQLYIHDIDVTKHSLLANVSSCLSKDSLKELLELLSRSKICPGNTGYDEICRARGGNNPAVFLSHDGKTVSAYEEVSFDHNKTVRHSNCSLLMEGTNTHMRCEKCSQFRGHLNVMSRRQEKKEETILTSSSKTRHDYLSSDQRSEKLTLLIGQKKQLKRKLAELENSFSDLLKNQGVEVSEKLSASLQQIISDSENTFNTLSDESPQKLLWSQQMKYIKRCDKRQMRWHPTIIKWCIAIHTKSSKAYDLLRTSGFINLPHESTLRDYSHFTKAKSGWNVDIVNRIKEDINFKTLEEYQKNVILMFDEIRIKDGLVYSTETGELVGFIDLGDINNEIEKLVNICKEGDPAEEQQQLATHIIAFMVRGLFLNLHYVFGHFPCTGFNSHQLYWSVWPAVGILECAGFHVRAFVCDGATPNRKFYRIHATRQNGLTFYAENRYRPGSKIYFICDPPHLMKTTRNNWENSNWHNKTRNLEVIHGLVEMKN